MDSFDFVKMHALGNDFVVIDLSRQQVEMNAEFAKSIADRYTGIGCDQILLVEPHDKADNIFDFQIFNADGSQSQQCGNGASCAAKLIHDLGYMDGSATVILRTAVDALRCTVLDDSHVTSSLGVPKFAPADVPFAAEAEQPLYSLDDVQVSGAALAISVLSIGNPHAAVQVDDADAYPVAQVGAQVESHARFPEKTNVEFTEVVASDRIRLRVFERGVGETLACGSGACAAVIAGRRQGLLSERVTVMQQAGEAVVEWTGPDSPVYLTVPTTYVFEGRYPAP